MGSIERIVIAAEKGAHATSVAFAEAVAGRGLEGDRYALAENRKEPGQEITLIEAEQLERFVAETALAMAPEAPRRNLVTRGVDLNALVGKRFQVGPCELEGVELCEPCAKWARNTHNEVVRFFVHRGGLNARIVRGGTIRVGAVIRAAE